MKKATCGVVYGMRNGISNSPFKFPLAIAHSKLQQQPSNPVSVHLNLPHFFLYFTHIFRCPPACMVMPNKQCHVSYFYWLFNASINLPRNAMEMFLGWTIVVTETLGISSHKLSNKRNRNFLKKFLIMNFPKIFRASFTRHRPANSSRNFLFS